MVVCKFFQQGYCRYGQNCRFEHIYGAKYTYQANPNIEAQVPGQNIDEQLVNQVQSDVQATLKGGQWILSSYAPFKEKPMYPGLTDLSPEEARLFIYEAKAKNSLDQAVAYINNLCNENRLKYEQMLQPTANIIKVIRSLYKGEIPMAPLTSQSSIFNSAVNSSTFGQSVSNVNPIFNQNSNNTLFGSQPENVAAKSIFAQANQAVFGPQTTNNVFQTANETVAPKSLFAQQNQSIFGPNPTQNNAANIFASANQNIFGQQKEPFAQNSSPFQSSLASNIFQTAQQTADVFKTSNPQSPFGVISNPQSPFGVTPNPQSPFGGNTNFEQTASGEDADVYSNTNELSVSDLKAFKSKNFQLGFVPEVPPPKSLCI